MTPSMIWVIDDSPTVRSVLQTALQYAGFQVESFADGVEAYARAISTEVVPALIFVDLLLPSMHGYTVIKKLTVLFQKKDVLPLFVVISRCDGAGDFLKAKLAGAQDYLVKPFYPSQALALCSRHHIFPSLSQTPDETLLDQ